MRRILVIDDSPTSRGLVVGALELLPGALIEEADGGIVALRQLARQSYDLIVTDINMPDMHGLEIISFVRQTPHGKTTPILIVSTEASAADRQRGLALGANAYLTKPFEQSVLLQTADQLLGMAS